MAVRRASSADARAMGRLHVEHLPIGLFPSLGVRFVARWHLAHIDSGQGIALVSYDTAAQGEPITGFLVGSIDRASFRRELLTRHRRDLLLHGACALLVRPLVLARFLRTRSATYVQRLRRPRTADPTPGPLVADLTAIAVTPGRHRDGIGRALMKEFLRICTHGGATRAELVADDDASGFYERTGWRRGRPITTRDGRGLHWFSMDLRDAGGK